MTRVDIINTLIQTRGYSSYLQIGVGRGDSFLHVACQRKVGVDNSRGSVATVFKTSDDFFVENSDRFDMVFIDGLHLHEQVLRDIHNALVALNPGGVVVLHDCLPMSASMGDRKACPGAWCGDVYRAAAWYFARSPYLCYTVDVDFGVGVIDTAFGTAPCAPFPRSSPEELTYDEFTMARSRLLHVVDHNDFHSLVDSGDVPEHGCPLYVITPTGDRLESFRLCVKYMNRQTLAPDKWIIVDDGVNESVSRVEGDIAVPHEVIRLEPMRGHSLVRNMREAMRRVPSNAMLCIIEDDDWYHEGYLESMAACLAKSRAVASWGCYIYNVALMQCMHGVRRNKHAALHCLGFTGDALAFFRDRVALSNDYSIDDHFCSGWKGEFTFCYGARVVHIAGVPYTRKGTTSPHRLGHSPEPPWHADPDGKILRAWLGEDADAYKQWDKREGVQLVRDRCGGFAIDDPAVREYPADAGRVYVFSNVRYCEAAKLDVRPDDVLVFTNAAESFCYYAGHKHVIVVHRYQNRESQGYGRELSGAEHIYIYGGSSNSIPPDFLRSLWAKYDRNYPGERLSSGRVIRSMTTGYVAAKYMASQYPDREIVLVNFGFSVTNSTRRSPAHNWEFEDRDLRRFRHVLTDTPVATYSLRDFSPDEAMIIGALGGDWDLGPGSSRWAVRALSDYSHVYAPYISRLRFAETPVLLVGFPKTSSHVLGIGAIMPGAGVHTICDVSDGCDLSTIDWSTLPRRFGLILVNGRKVDGSFGRHITELVDRLYSRGVLIVEGVYPRSVGESIASAVPGSHVVTRSVIDIRGDACSVVYDCNEKQITKEAVDE